MVNRHSCVEPAPKQYYVQCDRYSEWELAALHSDNICDIGERSFGRALVVCANYDSDSPNAKLVEVSSYYLDDDLAMALD